MKKDILPLFQSSSADCFNMNETANSRSNNMVNLRLFFGGKTLYLFAAFLFSTQLSAQTPQILKDINGRILQRIKIANGSQTFDLSNYVNGLHLIRLSNNETLKVMKQ